MTRVLAFLRHWVTFSGRARRLEFWLFWLIVNVVENLLRDFTQPYGDPDDGVFAHGPARHILALGGHGALLAQIITLILIVPMLAVMSRRLHDSGLSARWLLLALTIPVGGGVLIVSHQAETFFLALVGPLILAGLALRRGDLGPNRFGPDPKGTASASRWTGSARRDPVPMSVAGPSVVAPIRWYVVGLRRYADSPVEPGGVSSGGSWV